MATADTFSWLTTSKDIHSLLSNLEFLSGSSRAEIKICVFLTNGSIVDMIPTADIKRVQARIETLNKQESIYKFDFTLFGNLGDEEKSRGIYFKHPDYEDVFLYVSMDTMSSFKRVIRNYFNKFYPNVARIFLTSRQIKSLLNHIATHSKSDVTVSRFVVRRRYPDGSTDVKYKDEKITYIQAFFEAEGDNYWVTSLNLFADNVDAYISREGYFIINRGSFRFFREAILDYVLSIAQKRRKFFSGRERRKETEYQSKPIVIKFDQSIFNTIKDIEMLINRAFNNIPDSSYSIAHFNPYLQMTFTDFGDGSSFDIWVLERDKVILVPQFRATYNAIGKIVNSIFANFYEGIVIDFKSGRSEGDD